MSCAAIVFTVGASSLQVGHALAAPAPPGWQVVSYRGASLQVPVSWPVIDSDKSPKQCSRADRHAVYLGTMKDGAECPSRVIGRTESVQISQLNRDSQTARMADRPTTIDGKPARINSNSSTINTIVDVFDKHNLQISISYGSDWPTAKQIRDSLHINGPEQAPAAPATAPSTVEVDAPFQGAGFDACSAPSTDTMQSWLSSSYRAVGIYIGGIDRACDQPNLSPSWISTVQVQGWSIFPIYIGRQAPCAGLVNPIDPTNAYNQGVDAANDAAAQAKLLGMANGTPLFFDMESYGNCSAPVVSFLNGYDTQLHNLQYQAGVYESVANLNDLISAGTSIAQPDQIDFARWDGVATTSDSGISPTLWSQHQRIKQFLGGHDETYGGVTINVDSNQLDASLTGLPQPPPSVSSGWSVVVPPGFASTFFQATDGTLQNYYVGPNTGGWQHKSLGGTPAGIPTAVVLPAGSTNVFVKGTDGTLQNYYLVTNTGAWQNQSLGGQMAGDPSAVVLPNGTLSGSPNVFFRGTDGSLQNFYYDPSSGWHSQNLGGQIVGTPTAVILPGGSTNVFAQGTDGTLQNYYVGTNTGGWQRQSLGGQMTGNPSAVVLPNGTPSGSPNVFFKGGDGSLENFYYDPSSGWHSQSLGGQVAGTTSAVILPGGSTNVFVKGGDTTLLNFYIGPDSGGWQRQSLGGQMAGDPTTIVLSDGTATGSPNVFFQAPDSTLQNFYYAAGWHSQSLGGQMA